MIPENDREQEAEFRDFANAWQLPSDGEAPADESCPYDPRLTLAELIEQETARYRSWKSEVGDFFAAQMESLASLVRWLRATSIKDLSNYMNELSEGLEEEV
jgi:hypothetical protein